jgi:transposase-like protein
MCHVTRRYSPVEVIRVYARRTPEIDRVILSAFVLGLSTRKVGETLLSILGRPISAETVSQVAKTLDCRSGRLPSPTAAEPLPGAHA